MVVWSQPFFHMVEKMKKLKCLALCLLVGTLASSALAADAAPFYFGNSQPSSSADSTKNNKYWDNLMKYKMFGTTGITFLGRQVVIPDSSGWFGTAKGDFISLNNWHHVGGPILIGGDISLESGDGDDTLSTGPVRVTGSIKSANRNGTNVSNGIHCVKGSVDSKYLRDIHEERYIGESAYGSCTADKAPLIDTTLTIPNAGNRRTTNVGTSGAVTIPDYGVAYIDIPPTDGKDLYDLYIPSITFSNGGHLYIRMQNGGRLTRIFLENGFYNFIAGNSIQVVYMNDDASYSGGSWSGSGKIVANKDTTGTRDSYSGNLLFYTTQNVTFPAMNPGDTIQGTFITTGTIHVKQHMVLAGQLLANFVKVDAEFDGSGFLYVPFDPPVLNLVPQADTPLEFPENDLLVKVPIALDTPAPVAVYFDYCFDLANSTASLDDFNVTNGVSHPVAEGHPFPLCSSGSVGKVVIPEKGKTPSDAPNESVWINVAKDDKVEKPNEKLRLVIKNLVGAVLPGNKRQGYFDLVLVDGNVEPKSEDFDIPAIEDEVYTFASSEFKYTSAKDKAEKGIVINSLPTQGYLISHGDTLTSADLGKLIPIDANTEVDLQYIGAKDGFGVNPPYATFTFSVVDEDNVLSEDPYTVTVKVSPVNDAPTVLDATFTIDENSVAPTKADGKIDVNDVDDTEFTYEFDASDANYAKVSSLYTIDASTGEISPKTGATLNYESIDSVLTIKVKVTDAASTTGGTDAFTVTSNVTIKINDVNEAPIVRDTTFSVEENSPAGTPVGQVVATDPDTENPLFGTLTYTIDENTDFDIINNVPFAIDRQGNITVSEDNALDFETQPVWTIHVTVTDGLIPQTVEVVINLIDKNEPPHIDDILQAYVAIEHSSEGTPVTSPAIKISDPDAGDSQSTLRVDLEGITDNDAIATQLFVATIARNESDNTLRIMITVADSAKLNYETLLANGADTVSYGIRLILKDREGTGFADTASTTIFVKDINETPTAEDGAFSVAENSPAGTVVGTVVASDPDTAHAEFGTLYYSFMEETTQFVIDESTGKITVAENAVIDYETTPNHQITLHVAVTDRIAEPQIATVVITITNVNENPELTCIAGDDKCNGPFEMVENAPTDTVIHKFAVVDVDADNDGVLTAEVLGVDGNRADTLFAAKFNADTTEVWLVVKDGSKFDYETILPVYELVIKVSDQGQGLLSDTLIRKVYVKDVNEAPVIADKTFKPDENIADGDTAGVMVVTDPDILNEEFRHFEFSILTENMPFEMDSNVVKVSDASKLNYETSPVFEFDVEVKNCVKNDNTGLYTDACLADTAHVIVSLQDVNEKPDIGCLPGDTNCNGPFSVAENSKTGTEIHAFAISDVDGDDLGKLTASLTDNGNTDAGSLFDVRVSATNDSVYVVVKDSAKLDFESIAAVHEVIITVYDRDSLSDTLIRKIEVIDVNEAPVIADSAFDPDENLADDEVVGEMKVDDPDKLNEDFRHFDFSIITSDMPFYMDSNKVRVADASKLDYETSPVFEFQVEVKNCVKNANTGLYTDACLADTATVTITLQDVNEKPDLKCIEGDTKCNGPFEMVENAPTDTVIHKFAVVDVDKDDKGKLQTSLTDKNGRGADTLFTTVFNADTTEVWLVVKDGSKLNYEAIDSTYEVILTVYDRDSLSDTLIRIVNVIDVNEAPTVDPFNETIEENLPDSTKVGELVAADPDTKHSEFSQLTYKIIDENIPFYLDSNVIKVADSEKLDFETKKEFSFYVEVSDGEYQDTAKVTIKLKDMDENPKIIVDDGPNGKDDTEDDSLCVAFCDTTSRGHTPDSILTVKVLENVPDSSIVFAYVVSDEDRDEVARLKPSMKDNNGTGADSIFAPVMKKVGDKWKIAVIVKDSSKLDYEKIAEEHEVTIFVTDSTGLQDSIVRIIRVIDVNEAPTVEQFDKLIEENLPDSAVVGELVAADPDSKNPDFRKLTYRILDEDVPFFLDSNVIRVGNSSELNYEKNTSFSFYVEVSDGEFQDTAKVTIGLDDVDESPKIITDDGPNGKDDADDDSLCVAHCDTTNRGSGDEHGKNILTVGIDENVKTGTPVLVYRVYDEDTGDLDSLKPSLVQMSATVDGSSAEDLFDIAMVSDSLGWKIVVSVKDGSKLDYEALRKAEKNSDPDPEYTVRIIVAEPDGYKDALKDTIIRVIRVQDVNEDPIFEVFPCEIAENNEVGDSLGRIEHPTDPDSLSKTLSFYNNVMELIGGDTALFALDTTRGPLNYILTAKVEFDCESRDSAADTLLYKCGIDGAYHVVVNYYDPEDPSVMLTKEVPVTLIDVNEKPKITTDSVEVKENVKKGTVVDTIKATDPDVYDSVLTYTLVEDKSGCFEVSKRGVITVKKDNCPALDYEENKELPITVKVTDNGTHGGGEETLSDTKTVIVKITDVNEAPKIDDKTIHVSEDAKVKTPIDTVTATDPDKNPAFNELVYRIVKGDTSVFKIDSVTGVITLKDSLDYESTPEYTLMIEVDDGEFTDTAKVTVKVDNVVETPKVEIILAETTDSTWKNPDTLYINTKDLCIEWTAMERKSEKVLKDSSECGIKLDEGENIIIRKFDDPSMDYPGFDTLVVYVSTKTPIVTIRKADDERSNPNIFTVVEQSAKADTAFYVNDPSNEIIVTVKDPVEKTEETFSLNVDLDTVTVPSKTYKTVSEITEFGIALNENPSSGATHTPVNGEKIAVTYTEKVNGKNVQITYYTDNDGEVIKNADGVEEITVTYTEKINGIDVKISYQADAATGAVIKTSGGYVNSDDETEISSSSSGKSEGKSSSSKGGKSSSSSKGGKTVENEVVYTISYETVDEAGNVLMVSYGVDAEGNIVKNENGCVGYELTYSYTNKYGNTATQSLFIVLDQVPPEVKILYPTEGEIIYSNYVDVKWTVDIGDGKGPIVQDTLVTQSLDKGGNAIVRFYRDKAGNIASDTVRVVMKNAKDMDIAVEQPVTQISKDKVAEYYATNEPEENESFAVSIYNPKTGKEVETLVGGDYVTKEGSGDVPYPGFDDHLGPTLGIETKVPSVNAVGGLATLDDIVKDGLVMLEDVDADNSIKIPVEEYVEKYCSDEFAEKVGADLSSANLYKTKMYVKIWIYTTLGSFVDYYSFTQDLDNPDYANDAGLLTLYFEMKPDRDGNVRTQDGRLMATGAYIYKTEVEMKMELRCSLPPFDVDSKGNVKGPKKASNTKGTARSVTEDMLKSFGYKRPEKK